jgi:signal peptidase I
MTTRRSPLLRQFVEILLLLLVAGGIAWAIRANDIEVSPVVSQSMEPHLMRGDAAMSIGTRLREPQIGDVIVFTADLTPDAQDVRIVHRWIGYKADGTLLTKGDNNDSVDYFTVEPDRVIGVQVGSLPTHYLRNPWTIPLAGAALGFIVLLWLLTPSDPPDRRDPPSDVSEVDGAVTVR